MDKVDKIKEQLKELIEQENCVLKDVLYVKEDNVYFLRVVIDKDPFIDIEDCVKITGIINPVIDELNLIEDEYVLDVCSYEKGSVEDGQ